MNAVTQPYGLLPEVPSELHGRIEQTSGLTYLLLPPWTGTTKTRSSLVYWLVAGAALVTVYHLTDWDADQ